MTRQYQFEMLQLHARHLLQEVLRQYGVSPEQIRISVGLENDADLIEDLRIALELLG